MLTEEKKKANNKNTTIISSCFVRGIIGSNDTILFDGKKQVAFIGRSNVGKSSVINTLVNKKNFAKSSSVPGKTKEINFFLINENIYFVDLPGYGYSKLSAKKGNKLRKRIIWYFSEEKIKPKFVVLIIDARIGVTRLDEEMLGILKEENHKTIVVVNKSDKLSRNELCQKVGIIKSSLKDKKFIKYIVIFSSKTKLGKSQLLNFLVS